METGTGVALARHTAAVLLVVDGQTATVADLTSSGDLLKQVNVEMAGAVLLRSPERWRAQRVKVQPVLAVSESTPAPERDLELGAEPGPAPESPSSPTPVQPTHQDESLLTRPRG